MTVRYDEAAAAFERLIEGAADDSALLRLYSRAQAEICMRVTDWSRLTAAEQRARIVRVGLDAAAPSPDRAVNLRNEGGLSDNNNGSGYETGEHLTLSDGGLINCAVCALLPSVGEGGDAITLSVPLKSENCVDALNDIAELQNSNAPVNALKLLPQVQAEEAPAAGRYNVWLLIAAMIGGGLLIYGLYSIVGRL